MFDGTVSPCEQAFMDLFVHDTGIDKKSIALTNMESNVFDESRNEHIKVQVHTVSYKGEEVWRVEPAVNMLAMQKENQHDAMEQHSSKQRYHSTCVLLEHMQQLELTIESTVSPVASDEEVLDEIAAAPTSIWCNTTTAINATPSSYGPGFTIFRESRKIDVENLIRAAAEEQQRLITVPEEREATVVEYCVFNGSSDVPDAEARDGGKNKDDMLVEESTNGSRKKGRHDVVKTAMSMASDNSSVYLNQEDDELSAQQQEAMNSFKVFNMNLFQLLDRE
jgi:hypothetical protein